MVQLDWIRRFSFWWAGSHFIQMDEGELCFKPNNRTWHSSHRYIIYTGVAQGTLVDLTQRKFASMVAATNGQD